LDQGWEATLTSCSGALAAARNNVPAVYSQSFYPRDGGLLLPTKFEMVVNLKRAKALGLAVPPSIRLRADEVIDQ
jgi:hypothetical protein